MLCTQVPQVSRIARPGRYSLGHTTDIRNIQKYTEHVLTESRNYDGKEKTKEAPRKTYKSSPGHGLTSQS